MSCQFGTIEKPDAYSSVKCGFAVLTLETAYISSLRVLFSLLKSVIYSFDSDQFDNLRICLLLTFFGAVFVRCEKKNLNISN